VQIAAIAEFAIILGEQFDLLFFFNQIVELSKLETAIANRWMDDAARCNTTGINFCTDYACSANDDIASWFSGMLEIAQSFSRSGTSVRF